MPGARSSVALAAVVLAAALLARGCDSKIVRASFVAADVAAGAAPVMLTSLADRLDIVILAGAPAASLCTNPFDGRACRVDVKASCEAARNPNKVDVLIPAFYDETQDDVAWRVRWRPDHDLARSVPQCTATPLLNGRQFAFATPLKISLKLPSATNGPTAPPGFAKVAPNKQYFVDSGSGDLLFPVGPNLAWSGGANSTKGFYGPAFTQLAAAGANYVRLWWGPSQAAYSPFSDTQLQRSLGKVDAGGAANVDWVLDQAEASGIRALAALDSYNSLCTNKQYFCSWSTSVYNKQNGGPLSQPDDFWTDSTSMNAFQDYARYVVSRWGASTSVFSWQMWNEMDGCLGGVSAAATSWLGNLTTYVRGIDVHHHLVDNSYAGESGTPADDALDSVDFTTTHAYESGDLGGTLAHYATIKSAAAGKPTYSGEFGRNADPRLTRTILHNGMWGTVAQLGAASGACWWWATLFGDKLLDEYTAISTFIEGLPLAQSTWQVVQVDGVASGGRVAAQASSSFVLGYVLNLGSIFGNNPPYQPLQPFSVTLHTCPTPADAAAGLSLTWFNTSSGSPLGASSPVSCTGGQLQVPIPQLSTDRAFTVS